jgi:hypothetical protein
MRAWRICLVSLAGAGKHSLSPMCGRLISKEVVSIVGVFYSGQYCEPALAPDDEQNVDGWRVQAVQRSN